MLKTIKIAILLLFVVNILYSQTTDSTEKKFSFIIKNYPLSVVAPFKPSIKVATEIKYKTLSLEYTHGQQFAESYYFGKPDTIVYPFKSIYNKIEIKKFIKSNYSQKTTFFYGLNFAKIKEQYSIDDWLYPDNYFTYGLKRKVFVYSLFFGFQNITKRFTSDFAIEIGVRNKIQTVINTPQAQTDFEYIIHLLYPDLGNFEGFVPHISFCYKMDLDCGN